MKPTLISQGAEAKIYLIKNSKNLNQDSRKKSSKENLKHSEGVNCSAVRRRDDAPSLLRSANDSEKALNTRASARQLAINEKFILPPKNFISKLRIAKSYRHPVLDEQIRRQRTKKECKILIKALQFGANVPKVFNTNDKGEPFDKFELKIEFIDGERLSETLNSKKEKEQFEILKEIGKQTAILHKNDIIHGDLTTSNTILQTSTKKVFIIDFGLGFISTKIEDKAVDLHLIKQALEAKHWQNWEALYKEFLKGYKWKDKEKVLEQLRRVELRGRNKH